MPCFINYRSHKTHINLAEVQGRFIPCLDRKEPCHTFLLVMNNLLLTKLKWPIGQRIKLFVPTPFNWWLAIKADEKGYASYQKGYKSRYRIMWPRDLPNPKMKHYQLMDLQYSIVEAKTHPYLVINLLR